MRHSMKLLVRRFNTNRKEQDFTQSCVYSLTFIAVGITEPEYWQGQKGISYLDLGSF